MENDQSQQKIAEEMPQEQNTPQGSTLGPVVGTIIIVAVLVIGGLYYWGAQLNKQAIVDETLTGEEIAAEVDTSTEALGVQGTSDEVTAIEDDLDLTDLSDLDAELGNIDAELGF